MERKAHDISKKARTQDIDIEENVDFSGLCLSHNVLAGLKASGFHRPSPIQLKAIPLGRCGLDLIVQAKSGTGKTCVFSVIALENLILNSRGLQVLVLAPTREIAMQIWEVVCSIGSQIQGLICHTFIGGMPVNEDKQKLRRCHIAIGTPGRIKQMIEEHVLSTDSIRLFVLDEADKLLEENFQDQINWIYSALPENKQMIALSATYPEYLAQHLTAYMRNPTFVRLNITDPALLGIRQYYCCVNHHPLAQVMFDEKVKVLKNLLSSVNFQQCLIFSNYQLRAQSLSDVLVSDGWPATYISGSLDQEDRLVAMEKLKKMQCRILISTDLTSRGIDVEYVNLVVNLDLPHDHETYLHRIGRAGRFGSYGAAISIVSTGKESKMLEDISQKCNTVINKLPDPVPEDLAKSSGYVNIADLVTTEKLVTRTAEGDPTSSEISHKDISIEKDSPEADGLNGSHKLEDTTPDNNINAYSKDNVLPEIKDNFNSDKPEQITRKFKTLDLSDGEKSGTDSRNQKLQQGSLTASLHSDLSSPGALDLEQYTVTDLNSVSENVEDMQRLTGQLNEMCTLVNEIKNMYITQPDRDVSDHRVTEAHTFHKLCGEYELYLQEHENDDYDPGWIDMLPVAKPSQWKVVSEDAVAELLLSAGNKKKSNPLSVTCDVDGSGDCKVNKKSAVVCAAEKNKEMGQPSRGRGKFGHHCRMGVGDMLTHLRSAVSDEETATASDSDFKHTATHADSIRAAYEGYEGDESSLPEVVDFSEYDQSYLFFESVAAEEERNKQHEYDYTDSDHIQNVEKHLEESTQNLDSYEGGEEELYYYQAYDQVSHRDDLFKWVPCEDYTGIEGVNDHNQPNKPRREQNATKRSKLKHRSHVPSRQNSESQKIKKHRDVKRGHVNGCDQSEHSGTESHATCQDSRKYASLYGLPPSTLGGTYSYMPYTLPMDPVQYYSLAMTAHSQWAQYYRHLIRSLKTNESLSRIYANQRKYIKEMAASFASP